MNLQVDVERVQLAHKAVRAELLAERSARGYWVGHTASSPLATAAAISALVAAHRPDTGDTLRESQAGAGQVIEQLVQGDLSEFLVESVHWLARHQNADGGWGDCDAAHSNIAATMLVQAAFRITVVPAKYADLIVRAEQYIAARGGAAGLRRSYGSDKTFVAAVLTSCALAGTVPWRQVPALPFELFCLPKRWQPYIQLPYPRYATATLLAIGRAKFHHDPPRNPLTRFLRRSIRTKSLAILERLQSSDDSFRASIPLTALTVASLASIGCREHPIVERGIEFLLASVRGDASWPLEVDLSVRNTTLALNSFANADRLEMDRTAPLSIRMRNSSALRDAPILQHPAWEDTARATETVIQNATSGQGQRSRSRVTEGPAALDESPWSEQCLDWLLGCQRSEVNPLTEAPPGGWAWSDLPGALPNAVDTAGALEALAEFHARGGEAQRERIKDAARRGVDWLLEVQQEEGGWATFYRDDSSFRLDESGADVTAQALRALHAWRHLEDAPPSANARQRIAAAVERGWRYLESVQGIEGHFIPLWFGNEYQSGGYNPVYGTAQVLMSAAALGRLDTELVRRAARWLVSAQHAGGGWGPPRAPLDYSRTDKDGLRAWRGNVALAKFCSVEETALGTAALLPLAETSAAIARAVSAGFVWLASAVEQDAHRRPAVIGFSLPKLWYHERLYPLVFAAGALSRAGRYLAPLPREIASIGSR